MADLSKEVIALSSGSESEGEQEVQLERVVRCHTPAYKKVKAWFEGRSDASNVDSEVEKSSKATTEIERAPSPDPARDWEPVERDDNNNLVSEETQESEPVPSTSRASSKEKPSTVDVSTPAKRTKVVYTARNGNPTMSYRKAFAACADIVHDVITEVLWMDYKCPERLARFQSFEPQFLTPEYKVETRKAIDLPFLRPVNPHLFSAYKRQQLNASGKKRLEKVSPLYVNGHCAQDRMCNELVLTTSEVNRRVKIPDSRYYDSIATWEAAMKEYRNPTICPVHQVKHYYQSKNWPREPISRNEEPKKKKIQPMSFRAKRFIIKQQKTAQEKLAEKAERVQKAKEALSAKAKDTIARLRAAQEQDMKTIREAANAKTAVSAKFNRNVFNEQVKAAVEERDKNEPKANFEDLHNNIYDADSCSPRADDFDSESDEDLQNNRHDADSHGPNTIFEGLDHIGEPCSPDDLYSDSEEEPTVTYEDIKTNVHNADTDDEEADPTIPLQYSTVRYSKTALLLGFLLIAMYGITSVNAVSDPEPDPRFFPWMPKMPKWPKTKNYEFPVNNKVELTPINPNRQAAIQRELAKGKKQYPDDTNGMPKTVTGVENPGYVGPSRSVSMNDLNDSPSLMRLESPQTQINQVAAPIPPVQVLPKTKSEFMKKAGELLAVATVITGAQIGGQLALEAVRPAPPTQAPPQAPNFHIELPKELFGHSSVPDNSMPLPLVMTPEQSDKVKQIYEIYNRKVNDKWVEIENQQKLLSEVNPVKGRARNLEAENSSESLSSTPSTTSSYVRTSQPTSTKASTQLTDREAFNEELSDPLALSPIQDGFNWLGSLINAFCLLLTGTLTATLIRCRKKLYCCCSKKRASTQEKDEKELETLNKRISDDSDDKNYEKHKASLRAFHSKLSSSEYLPLSPRSLPHQSSGQPEPVYNHIPEESREFTSIDMMRGYKQTHHADSE